MRRTVLMLWICLLIVGYSWPEPVSVDQYSISYTGQPISDYPHPPGGPKYLMKIDMFGNVLVPPVKVVSNSRAYTSPQVAATTISHNGFRWINMWIPDRRRLPDGYLPLFRAVIEKRTLRLVSLRRTAVRISDSSHIQVSQKGSNDFLALQAPTAEGPQTHVGLGITSTGGIAGTSWVLSSTASDRGSGISADGKAFLFVVFVGAIHDRYKMMLQPLGNGGRPTGKAIEVLQQRGPTPMDVSNLLSENRRFVMYNSGSQGDTLFLQVMDMRTAQKMGNPIVLAQNVGHFQAAAIDPLGRFVVYIAQKFRSQYVGDFLVYQALDATGRPSGIPKAIAKDVWSGIDILMD